MPKYDGQLVPYPNQIEEFGKLVNARGLVPMKITKSFAPYLLNDIAGFDPEQAARLFVRKEGVPVNDKGEIVQIKAQPPQAKAVEPAKVEIPNNWSDLHVLQLTRLAKQIAGDSEQRMSREDAEAIIVAELKRREDHAAEQNEK